VYTEKTNDSIAAKQPENVVNRRQKDDDSVVDRDVAVPVLKGV